MASLPKRSFGNEALLAAGFAAHFAAKWLNPWDQFCTSRGDTTARADEVVQDSKPLFLVPNRPGAG
jgi:hypothetical protein